MKILYVISHLAKQGPVNVLYNIISEMDLELHDVYIWTINSEINSSLLDKFSRLPITIYESKGNSRLTNFFRFQHHVNSHYYDVIHAHCLWSYLFAASLFYKSNSLKCSTVHIYPGVQTICKYGKIKGALMNLLYRLCYRFIDLNICCSKSLYDEFILDKNTSISHYVRNGVSPIKEIVHDEILSRELEITPNDKVFVNLSRFSPEKNLSFLIDSFNSLSEPNVKLIILGDGVLYDELKQKESSVVLMPGFTEEPEAYLSIADYYVSTSITEGLPMSVLESMSLGLPVLLSDIDAHKEIVDIDGKISSGLLFDNNNKESLIVCLNELLANKYNFRPKEIFDKYFSASNMSFSYLKLYEKFVK